MSRNTKENAIQFAGLVLALVGGYLIHGWTGILAGFVLFAVAIVVRVRFKMGKAQEIGKAQSAARHAALLASSADA